MNIFIELVQRWKNTLKNSSINTKQKVVRTRLLFLRDFKHVLFFSNLRNERIKYEMVLLADYTIRYKQSKAAFRKNFKLLYSSFGIVKNKKKDASIYLSFTRNSCLKMWLRFCVCTSRKQSSVKRNWNKYEENFTVYF